MIHPTEPMNPPRRIRGIFYGWWLVGIAALVMVLTSVPLFHAMPVWFPVLQRRFLWNRTQLSLAFTLSRVEGGIMGPVEGLLIQRLGPRRMVLIGMLILGVGFLLFSRVQDLWQFYAAFLVMALGQGMGGWLPVMTVINNWFVRRRAMAMSMVMVGQRLGGVLLPWLLALTIDPDQYGIDRWRVAALGIGVLIIFLAFPISRLVRDRPEDFGLLPDGGTAAPASSTAARAEESQTSRDLQSAAGARELTWQEAIRTKAFWLMSFGHACNAALVVTIMVHLGPMLSIDRGFSLQLVGLVVATYMAIGMVSTLVGGYIGDRVPIRLAIVGFIIMHSIGVIILILAHTTLMVFIFAVLYGIGQGRTPLTTATPSIYFGRRSFASITGMSMLPMNVFLLVVPTYAGIMFDINGSYTVPFITVVVLNMIGGSLYLLLGEPKPLPSVLGTAREAKG